MTEAEWVTCREPGDMLTELYPAGTASAGRERKVRLLACAYCRRIWHLVPSEALWGESLAVVERYAEGEASANELYRAYSTALDDMASKFGTRSEPVHAALCEVLTALSPVLIDPPHARPPERNGYSEPQLGSGAASAMVARTQSDVRASWWKRLKAGVLGFPFQHLWDAERSEQSNILRDIFGNPFRPVAFSPQWRTDTVLLLARQMYDSRDFSAMPILADALQDVGCDSTDILNHCRDPKQVHVCGCWVVDLVLGKE